MRSAEVPSRKLISPVVANAACRDRGSGQTRPAAPSILDYHGELVIDGERKSSRAALGY
jgi:hypothetical protein